MRRGEIVIRLQVDIDFIDEALWQSGEEQKRLAERLNVAPGTLSKYKKGNLPIPLEVLVDILRTKTGRTKPFISFMCGLAKHNKAVRSEICSACGGCLKSQQVVQMMPKAA